MLEDKVQPVVKLVKIKRSDVGRELGGKFKKEIVELALGRAINSVDFSNDNFSGKEVNFYLNTAGSCGAYKTILAISENAECNLIKGGKRNYDWFSLTGTWHGLDSGMALEKLHSRRKNEILSLLEPCITEDNGGLIPAEIYEPIISAYKKVWKDERDIAIAEDEQRLVEATRKAENEKTIAENLKISKENEEIVAYNEQFRANAIKEFELLKSKSKEIIEKLIPITGPVCELGHPIAKVP